MKVCVFCGSSDKCDSVYLEAAYSLGKELAAAGMSAVSGGGRIGSMGALADGAISNNGTVIGIIPRFMYSNGWGHPGLTELRIVDSLHERKQQMLIEADAFVALPGGYGTFDELFEVLTSRQLKLHDNSIILLNTQNFFQSFTELMKECFSRGFIEPLHRSLWRIAETPRGVVDALNGFNRRKSP